MGCRSKLKVDWLELNETGAIRSGTIEVFVNNRGAVVLDMVEMILHMVGKPGKNENKNEK